MRSLILELQQKESEYKSRIESLEKSLNAFPEVPNVEELERHVTLIEQQLERKEKEATALEHYLSTRDEEYTVAKLDLDTLKEENDRLKLELNESLSRQRDTFQSLEQLQNVRQELVAALELNKKLTEDLNRERVLRKKYFNGKTFENNSKTHSMTFHSLKLQPSKSSKVKSAFTAGCVRSVRPRSRPAVVSRAWPMSSIRTRWSSATAVVATVNSTLTASLCRKTASTPFSKTRT